MSIEREKAFLRFLSVFFLLAFVSQAAAFWFEPSINPPADLVSPPITVGPDRQVEDEGALTLERLILKAGSQFESLAVGDASGLSGGDFKATGRVKAETICLPNDSSENKCRNSWPRVVSPGGVSFSGGRKDRLTLWSSVNSINGGVSLFEELSDGFNSHGKIVVDSQIANRSGLKLARLRKPVDQHALSTTSRFLTLDSNGNVVVSEMADSLCPAG